MTIQASLLRQLNNPNLSRDGQADLRCQTAKQFEERGNYEAAREAMGELWQGIGERPNIAGLERSIAGEVLLRAGVLTGWIGDKRQIENSQEMAKNLISQSIAVFESLSFPKKILEARIELSVCYWREGAYDDAGIAALTLLEELSELLTADEMQTIYERAVQWLAKCQDPRTLQRLYQAAARVLSVARASKVTEGKGSTANVKELGKRYKLGEMVRRYEHDLIEQALISADTKVTRAARLLGISYQGLAYMLEHRHKDLLPKRSPKSKD
jgi:hypothetical protein